MYIEIYSTSQHYLGKLSAEKFDKVNTVFDWCVVHSGIDESQETYIVIELADVWKASEEQNAIDIFASA